MMNGKKLTASKALTNALKRLIAILYIGALVCACSTMGYHACPAGQRPVVNDLLYFGAAKPAGVVSADEWAQFIDSVVTPRFPQGLSMWQALGQWKSERGPIVREASYVLNVIHPNDAAAEAAVSEIVDAYKAKFRQDSVLRVRGSACASLQSAPPTVDDTGRRPLPGMWRFW